jgi:cytochrome P450
MDISANSTFSRAFDYASDQTGRRFQNPLYSLSEVINGSKFRASLVEVKRFGQQIVSKAIKTRPEKDAARKESRGADPEFGSLIDSLLDALGSDPNLAADAALNFLSAGRDTTAQSLTWTFYSLMRHPAALASLREEAKLAFGSTVDSVALPVSPPKLTVADLQPVNLPVTMSIFHESLRLHPPVPLEIKQCQTDILLPDGTFLPSGSIIVWCIWAMNRAHSIWGSDSQSFRPDRWLQSQDTDTEAKTSTSPPTRKLLTKSPSEYPVFNGGARSCLGKKMAELLACWTLLHVSTEFELEECGFPRSEAAASASGSASEKDCLSQRTEEEETRPERTSKNSLTLPMHDGLPCRVRLRAPADRSASLGTARLKGKR